MILLMIFAIALMPKTVIRVAHWGLTILARVGVSTAKVERWRAFVDGEVYSFSEKFKLSAGHFSSMAITVVITMLQLAFFYLVPYFIMLAFGKHEVDFLSVMAASAFVQLLSTAVPLPGGTGDAEGGFALFLGHFYGEAATAGYLLWRLITFIAPTILAAPLLGLKSAHNESIHARWDRLVEKRGRKRSDKRGASTAQLLIIMLIQFPSRYVMLRAPECPKMPRNRLLSSLSPNKVLHCLLGLLMHACMFVGRPRELPFRLL